MPKDHIQVSDGVKAWYIGRYLADTEDGGKAIFDFYAQENSRDIYYRPLAYLPPESSNIFVSLIKILFILPLKIIGFIILTALEIVVGIIVLLSNLVKGVSYLIFGEEEEYDSW